MIIERIKHGEDPAFEPVEPELESVAREYLGAYQALDFDRIGELQSDEVFFQDPIAFTQDQLAHSIRVVV